MKYEQIVKQLLEEHKKDHGKDKDYIYAKFLFQKDEDCNPLEKKWVDEFLEKKQKDPLARLLKVIASRSEHVRDLEVEIPEEDEKDYTMPGQRIP